jgi:hypothetical protein
VSRGYGKVQQQILKVVNAGAEYRDHRWPLRELTSQVFGATPGDVTRAHAESVRRAAKSLARDGLVQIGYQRQPGSTQAQMTVSAVPVRARIINAILGPHG